MTQLAPLNQSGPGITFTVDDVTPSDTRSPVMTVEERLRSQTGRGFVELSHPRTLDVVAADDTHPLVTAVNLAFGQHLPLVLSPDDLWITIVQGFGHHVNNNAEELRSSLVDHGGRKTLVAQVKNLSREGWEDAVAQWERMICKKIPADLRDSLICDFSTTTPAIRTAGAVAVMDAFKRYFEYFASVVCGIPHITLRGTADDWRKIRQRVDVLSRFKLQWWTDRLIPICDGFVQAAEGQPDRAFWREICKPKHVYFSEVITGWIADLFPYLRQGSFQQPTRRNPVLDKPRHLLTGEDGLSPSCFPSGLSEAPVTVEFQDGSQKPYQLLGGFLGAVQDTSSGRVSVEIGWGVQERDGLELYLEKIRDEHRLLPARADDPSPRNDLDSVRSSNWVELSLLLDHFDGAEIYPGTAKPWIIRRYRDWVHHSVATSPPRALLAFGDLKDGRVMGVIAVPAEDISLRPGAGRQYERWIVLWRPRNAVLPHVNGALTAATEDSEQVSGEDCTLIAKSFLHLFEQLFAADGRYFFDDPDFVPDDSLAARLKE